jgi:glycogenin glucosyltransferase
VTPAPVRRPSFWGDENEPLDSTKEGHTNSLPTAEGVPSQTEWVCLHGRRWGPADCRCDLADLRPPYKDPVVQLQVLAQQQSEALLRKLSGDDGISGRRLSHEMPSRSLPFGSEPVESPTYVSQYAPANVLSPQPVPGKSATAGVVEDLTGRTDISPDMAVGDDMAASTTEATQ